MAGEAPPFDTIRAALDLHKITHPDYSKDSFYSGALAAFSLIDYWAHTLDEEATSVKVAELRQELKDHVVAKVQRARQARQGPA